MVPFWRSAQECQSPEVIAVASVMPSTSTGTEEPASSPLVPLPSWPYALWPQHVMVPFWRSAQECKWPAVMDVASVMPSTSTGTEEPVFVLLPSWPYVLWPQHVVVPFWRSAQECASPAVMAVASVMPSTLTGTEESVFVSLPSWPYSL